MVKGDAGIFLILRVSTRSLHSLKAIPGDRLHPPVLVEYY